MSKDAYKVTLDQLREALTVLGIEPDTKNLRTVFIEPGQITVVRHRVDENGKNYVAGYDQVATETVTIAVVDK